MTRTHLVYAAGAAVLLYVLWAERDAIANWLTAGSGTKAVPPVVPGTITSGSQSAEIDTNVLSPDFGHPITPVLKE